MIWPLPHQGFVQDLFTQLQVAIKCLTGQSCVEVAVGFANSPTPAGLGVRQPAQPTPNQPQPPAPRMPQPITSQTQLSRLTADLTV